MSEELFKETIKGKQYIARKVKEDGVDVIIVEVDGKKHRYSPDYTVDELKFALSDGSHSQQKYEARNG